MKPITLVSVPFFLIPFAAAISYDCSDIQIDKKNFDLSKIGGPHSVLFENNEAKPGVIDTTWTVDICNPLKKLKNITDGDQCSSGTQVCGIRKTYNLEDDPDKENGVVSEVIEVAGNFIHNSGGRLDPKVTRLKSTDADTDGIQLELNGGKNQKRKQRAVIQFQCDKQRTGNEKNKFKRSDDNKEEEEEGSLTYVSYGPVDGKEELDVLRLNWRTKYACEEYEKDKDDKESKGGWGFFTWFILIAFMGTAAYLIFGSWLNYNRYGARGWDLLPHGDTIRDIPYLVKDWSRKVVDTVSSGGSRGGYSAV